MRARNTAGLEWQQIRLSQPDISMQAQPAIARLRTRSSRYSASALGPAGACASPDDEIPRPHPTCLRPLAVALRAEDVHQYLRRVVGLDGRDHEVEGRGRYGEARALAEGLHPPMRPSGHGHHMKPGMRATIILRFVRTSVLGGHVMRSPEGRDA